ncbi:cyclophilin-like fold protein [Acidovorax sp. NCPPB 3576]|uniref:cyclophilin-like fold protein n=1 Tax=Acidovorax sp. NCPPB 3576 TaxID=2940488 RepID=UPI002349512C|nr:cyclophilin-like fold protein [Acidovorax sp. NCPPB 3576]WCM88089.1 cyclophilin-like fold protein [Acidovorax sp. NCPPB 3576]
MTQHLSPFAMAIQIRRSWCLRLAGLFIGAVVPGGSHAAEGALADMRAAAVADAGAAPMESKRSTMRITIGERRFAVTLADTEAARAFAAQLPLTLDMTDLNGNEKKFDLPNGLPSSPSRPGTIHNGDLMLYGTNTVVLFYLSFGSPYSYTRLGRVDDPNGLAQALGRGRVKVGFSRQ